MSRPPFFGDVLSDGEGEMAAGDDILEAGDDSLSSNAALALFGQSSSRFSSFKIRWIALVQISEWTVAAGLCYGLR